jgi:hypothetical protein
MCLNRIETNVFTVARIIESIADTVVHVAPLPDFTIDPKFLASSMRKPSFYELQRSLDGDLSARSQEHMDMIGHEHKLMNSKLLLIPVAK